MGHEWIPQCIKGTFAFLFFPHVVYPFLFPSSSCMHACIMHPLRRDEWPYTSQTVPKGTVSLLLLLLPNQHPHSANHPPGPLACALPGLICRGGGLGAIFLVHPVGDRRVAGYSSLTL